MGLVVCDFLGTGPFHLSCQIHVCRVVCIILLVSLMGSLMLSSLLFLIIIILVFFLLSSLFCVLLNPFYLFKEPPFEFIVFLRSISLIFALYYFLPSSWFGFYSSFSSSLKWKLRYASFLLKTLFSVSRILFGSLKDSGFPLKLSSDVTFTAEQGFSQPFSSPSPLHKPPTCS